MKLDAIDARQHSLASIITWITVSIAVLVAVALPLGYWFLSSESQNKEMDMNAKLYAAFVTQIIIGNPTDWRIDAPDLISVDLTSPSLPEVRSIRDNRGVIIAKSQGELEWPVRMAETPLLDGTSQTVGFVQMHRSLAPVAKNTAYVAFFSISMGLAIFLTLRMLPLRALNTVLRELNKEKQTLKENEEQLRIIFENAADCIITFDAEGAVVSANPAAENLFRRTYSELVGIQIHTLIKNNDSDAATDLKAAYMQKLQREAIGLRPDNTHFPVEFSVSVAEIKGETRYVGIVRDITERKDVENRMMRLANFDNLTNLPNRTLFRDRLSRAIERSKRRKSVFALMFLDLDRFKTVNDSLGHDVGDRLLIHVANLLQSSLRRSDTLARFEPEHADDGVGILVSRLGGDEFTIILEDISSPRCGVTVATKILNALWSNPFIHDDKKISVSASIGIALFPNDSSDDEGLIKQADTAMYRSKETGRGSYHFYTSELNALANKRLSLETDLRRAVENSEFVLHFQPKSRLSDGAIVGAEALIRWQRSDTQLVAPGEFITALEETGLICQVGEWATKEACAQLKRWHMAGFAELTVAVNLSVRQLQQLDFVSRFRDILSSSGVNPKYIELEVTESMLMLDAAAAAKILRELKAIGVSISIDDFGTGYSSLGYLKGFSIDTLKIDRSFVRDITTDPDDAAIASAVIALAHSLRLKVVAEGVENKEQLIALEEKGCDIIQGYYLSRPLSSDAIIDWLKQQLTLQHEMQGGIDRFSADMI